MWALNTAYASRPLDPLWSDAIWSHGPLCALTSHYALHALTARQRWTLKTLTSDRALYSIRSYYSLWTPNGRAKWSGWTLRASTSLGTLCSDDATRSGDRLTLRSLLSSGTLWSCSGAGDACGTLGPCPDTIGNDYDGRRRCRFPFACTRSLLFHHVPCSMRS